MPCHSSCPACGDSHLQPLPGVLADRLARCRHCGLVFEQRIPSDRDLALHYAQYGYAQLKPCPPATRVSYQQVLASLIPWRAQGRLLDIGCGQGDFLHEASLAGWMVQGTEFSPEAVALCRSRGLTVSQGEAAALAASGLRFDVVTGFEVLEHLRSPADLLRDADSLLEPGGLLYLTTPNFNALLRYLEGASHSAISYPDHLCFLTPGCLRQLARRHGFRVASIISTGLDPWRLRSALSRLRPAAAGSIRSQSQAVQQASAGAAVTSQRNRLRELSYSSRGGVAAKAAVNAMLKTFGCGDTLKAWLVKL